jgi:DNA-binding GntR family transcriptional regulator
VTGGEQRLLAIAADKKIQEHFGVPRNHPILRLDRKLETNRLGFHFYSQVYCNTENYSLTGRF